MREALLTGSIRNVIATAHFLWRKIPFIGIFFSCFLAVSTLIHVFIPYPSNLSADGRAEKIELLEHWISQVNVGVFGTSRINEALDPRLFDQGLARANNIFKSINLAVYGGSQTEQRFMAGAFLDLAARKGVKACLVILELNAGVNFPPENRFHPRAINIYDGAALDFVYNFSNENISIFRRFGRVAFAVMATAAHYINVGMLSSIIFPP